MNRFSERLVGTKRLLVLSLLLTNYWSFAQFAPEEAPVDEDQLNAALNPQEPAAPIDNWILPVFFVGVVTGYLVIRESRTIKLSKK